MDKKILALIFGAVLLAGLVILPSAIGSRTEINCTTWVENDNPASVATATTLDSTNGHYIGFEPFLMLRVNESGGVAGPTLITVLAGDDPPAFRKYLGNGSYIVSNATPETWIGPFESARFVNSTGYLLVNTNSTDGTIEAFKFPV